jgi:hypothetical protein
MKRIWFALLLLTFMLGCGPAMQPSPIPCMEDPGKMEVKPENVIAATTKALVDAYVVGMDDDSLTSRDVVNASFRMVRGLLLATGEYKRPAPGIACHMTWGTVNDRMWRRADRLMAMLRLLDVQIWKPGTPKDIVIQTAVYAFSQGMSTALGDGTVTIGELVNIGFSATEAVLKLAGVWDQVIDPANPNATVAALVRIIHDSTNDVLILFGLYDRPILVADKGKIDVKGVVDATGLVPK